MAEYTVKEPSPTGFCSVLDSDGNYLGGGYTKESATRIAAALNKAELFDEMRAALLEMTDIADGSEPCVGATYEIKTNHARAILAKVNEQ